MKQDDEKVYKENEKDMSDDALARSKSTELVRVNQERTEYKEKLRHYTFLKNNASPARFKHKQILFQLYLQNQQSWHRAKRVFILKYLAKPFKLALGPKLEEYLRELQDDIEYEQTRLNNKELITQKAIESLEEASTTLNSVMPEDNEDRIKLGYAQVNLARGYRGMLPKEPLFVNNNNINNSKTNNTLNIIGESGKLGSTETELAKIAKKYNITIGQARKLAKNLITAKKQALEQPDFIETEYIEETVNADTLEQ